MSKQTPLKAIKAHCKWCQGGSLQWVRDCGDDVCPLLALREGKAVKGISPLKTIRAKCRECVETSQDVKECPGEMFNGFCPLHPFRFGRKPESLSKSERDQVQKDPQNSSEAPSFEPETVSEG